MFSGEQEAPDPGDPTGFAFGTLTIDPNQGSGIYGSIAWDFTYGDLSGNSTLTGMHIHTGEFGQPGPIYFDMGTATTGGPNTLIQTLLDSNWDGRANWSNAGLQAIVDNPSGYFVNIHTSQFSLGAVRAQIPEPASLGLAGGAGLLLLRRRRVCGQ